jgi:hypothetical protein
MCSRESTEASAEVARSEASIESAIAPMPSALSAAWALMLLPREPEMASAASISPSLPG